MQLPPHNNVMNYSSVAKPKAQKEYAISSQNLSASKLTEAKATKLLERYLYNGCGIATNEDIACWMAINEFCRTTSLQDDGGVPEDRAEKIWEAIHRAGKVKHKWCVKRWRLIRDHLHERKIVICDYESDRNKAYCYQPGQFHPSVKAKRRRRGTPGSYRVVTQKQRTTRPNTEGGYPVLANDVSGRNVDLDLFRVMQRGPPRSVSMNSSIGCSTNYANI